MTAPRFSPDALGRALRDVADHAEQSKWGTEPAVFALVPTEVLAATSPGLIDADDPSELSPVLQEISGLDDFLASALWPDLVAGAAVTMGIVVVPPTAGETSTPHLAPEVTDADTPGARPARLVAGVLRDGPRFAVLRLTPVDGEPDSSELLTHPDLATELCDALAATFEPDTA